LNVRNEILYKIHVLNCHSIDYWNTNIWLF